MLNIMISNFGCFNVFYCHHYCFVCTTSTTAILSVAVIHIIMCIDKLSLLQNIQINLNTHFLEKFKGDVGI